MKYAITFHVKVRVPNENTRAGVSWLKRPDVVIEADSLEEAADKAYNLPAPDDLDIGAVMYESKILRFGTDVKNRKDINIKVFKEF